jgi:TolB protein
VRPWPSLDPQFRLVRTGVFASHDASGARLVVNDQKAASLRNSVVLFNADGSGRKVVFGNPERNALAPAFSPAGDRIAFGVGQFFQTAQGAATADIAVIGAEGGAEPEILTRGGGNFGFPSWSPDGKRIVYRAAGADRNGLYIVDVATRAVTKLIEGESHANFPKWSPRGDRIAFTADIDGNYEVYTIAPDGSGLKRVTNRPGNDAHNAWSPDGEWIAFTSEAGGFKDESPIHPYNPQAYGDIFVVRADGSDVRMLTDDQFEDGTPSWIPGAAARAAGQ